MPGIEIPSLSPQQAVEKHFTIVDVRSPKEYAEGHVPGAVNLPLLDDRQRAAVGTSYHQRGTQEARVLAMDLVSGGLPTYLRAFKALAAAGRRLAVMCWRGGERSRNAVLLLGLVGVHAAQVQGGYKAYRRWVLDSLGSWRPDRPVVTLFGYTGSGKTSVMRHLAALAPLLEPRPAVIDLEGLALHRGSLLGGLNQPGRRTQKDFDALVWDALRRAEGDYYVFEGEGAKIGHIFLPESVARAVREGSEVLVAAGVEDRARAILEEYAPEGWGSQDLAQFDRGLELIAERLDPAAHAKVRAAFEAGDFPALVRELLVSYYDPLYRHSSIEGRDFAYTLLRSGNAEADARRLARDLPEMLQTTNSPRERVSCSR